MLALMSGVQRRTVHFVVVVVVMPSHNAMQSRGVYISIRKEPPARLRAALCSAVLCYALLCYAMLCYTMLCSVLCSALLSCSVSSS